jgi:hypothetical protein
VRARSVFVPSARIALARSVDAGRLVGASLATAWLVVGCSATPAGPRTNASEASLVTSARSLDVAPPAQAPTASTAPRPADAAPPSRTASPRVATIHVRATRLVEDEIVAIAVDREPLLAAVGPRAAWVSKPRGFEAHPLPKSALADPPPRLSIFFGRDDRIRVVGTRGSAGPAEYLRLLDAGYKVEKKEIGKLGDLKGGLEAVLGTADPEIVCRPDDECLVKSVRGWLTVATPPQLARVALGQGTGWAVGGRRIYRLGKGWEDAGVEGAWQSVDGLFGLSDRVYVLERSAGALHELAKGALRTFASPITGPRGLWGASADDLWLVGDGGLAHYDGGSWSVAEGAPSPLVAVLGRDATHVWVGGPGGLFRIEPAP